MSQDVEIQFASAEALAECGGMRRALPTLTHPRVSWHRAGHEPSLTTRRFLDLGRTESMICPASTS